MINGNYTCYRISECYSNTATSFEKNRVYYSGKVYDLTLERNHIMYIRRKGKCYWGSNCLCYTLPILKTEDEFLSLDDAKPSVNAVTDTPANFKQWVRDNKDRIERASEQDKLPYFLRDNPEAWERVLYPERYEIRSNDYRGNIINRAISNIQTGIIARKFKDVTTANELKSIAEKLFTKAVGNNVEISIQEDLMPLNIAKAHLTELLSIVKDYEIKQGKLTDIILGYKPEAPLEYGCTKYESKDGSKRIFLTNIIDDRDPIKALRNSRCDKDRLSFSLASHEGGHLLFNYESPTPAHLVLFKHSVTNIWNDYITAFNQLCHEHEMQQRADIFIGTYGHKFDNLGEFIAECFQEYRNSRNPSKYALMLGKLIDAYFKR